MRKLLRRLFTARPKPDWTDLEAAKFFRMIIGQCTIMKKPLTLTVHCDGYETSVALHPKDNLTRYLFEWAQGCCFQLASGGVVSTQAENKSISLDPDLVRDVDTYIKFWAHLIARNGEFPVLMISRREISGTQRMLVTPGYDKDILKQFLRTAIQQTETLIHDIEIIH